MKRVIRMSNVTAAEAEVLLEFLPMEDIHDDDTAEITLTNGDKHIWMLGEKS